MINIVRVHVRECVCVCVRVYIYFYMNLHPPTILYCTIYNYKLYNLYLFVKHYILSLYLSLSRSLINFAISYYYRPPKSLEYRVWL